jgi:hypothetical protein
MNPIAAILLKNLKNPNALFIFPTDVSVSQWTDYLLRLLGGGTLAMDRFIAWDTFKQNSVKSRMQNRRSIPSALRKIFVSALLRENAIRCEAGEEAVFSSLIRVEWARQAAPFASWLTELLPQLGAWFTRATGLPAARVCGEQAAFEGDDRDLFTLTLRYAQFLEQNGLFEPAWESPPFDDTGKECFIFFPESLSDYSEYRELLEASEHVTPVRADSGAKNIDCDVFFYTNARSEIAEAALYIRALNERENIPWDSIVVSVPDADSYEPYLVREFTNRNIPFVKRTGKPLASYPAGQFFRSVSDCVSRDFAFAPLAELLLNRHLPWKDTELIQSLMDFGITNNCISSWVELEAGVENPVNVWEDAFANPFGGINPAVRRLFTDLKWRLNALRRAGSFAAIRKQYFSFRERFFDMERCLPETDLVLSRCISELMYLVEIEKNFPGVHAPDPFMLFVDYLGEVQYLAQQSESGVVILPYRTAAPAPFDCHVILGASQEKLSAVFSRLNFLPRKKREKLGLVDEDASETFINLHKLNSIKRAAFFCAEHTFSGYAIPHSSLGASLKSRLRYGEEPEFREKFSEDLFRMEGAFYRGVSGAKPEEGSVPPDFPPRLHECQFTGFENWLSRHKEAAGSGGAWFTGAWFTDETVRRVIQKRFCGNPRFPGKAGVSASSLSPYYQCSLRWLFERVLAAENITIEASLMTENISGQVYHAVLNHFFTELKNNNDVLDDPEYADDDSDAPGLPAAYRSLLEKSVDAVFAGFPGLSDDGRTAMSAVSGRLLKAERKQFYTRLEKCLAVFLSYFSGCRIAGSEAACQAEAESFFLNGTIDCILEDVREDSPGKGTAIIVDFKLRYMPDRAGCTGADGNGLTDFQLPMYLTLAEKNGSLPVHTALFFSIVDASPQVLFGVIQNKQGAVPKKEEDRIMRDSGPFVEIMNEFAEKAARFAAEISSGRLSVFNPEFEKCGNCAYHRVCRTIYKIVREQNLSTWGSIDGI